MQRLAHCLIWWIRLDARRLDTLEVLEPEPDIFLAHRRRQHRQQKTLGFVHHARKGPLTLITHPFRLKYSTSACKLYLLLCPDASRERLIITSHNNPVCPPVWI